MRCAVVSLVLLALAAPARAQVVSGTLLESESRAPLVGGVVSVLGEDSATFVQVRTDSTGGFTFLLPGGGQYWLRAAHEGYQPAMSPRLSLGGLDTLQVEFSLARDLVVLEPLVVKARSRRITQAARRFYDRAENNAGGTFITREEIERVNPLQTTELLRRIPGAQSTQLMGGNAISVRGGCVPSLFIDGMHVRDYRSIDDYVRPVDVEGMEVYRAAHMAPVEYQGLRAGCAVVLVWTRIQ